MLLPSKMGKGNEFPTRLLQSSYLAKWLEVNVEQSLLLSLCAVTGR
jgi:hypothetical protein